MRTSAYLLLAACSTVLAKHSFVRRQDANGTDAGDGSKETLDPVVPAAVDGDSLSVLTPNKAVKLAFQSSPTARKRDGQVTTVEVDFNFRYPTVPLDHSDYVAGISCTASTVKATFVDADGYQQAVKTWPTKSKFLLITSTAGCGTDDNSNGYFVASSASFDSSSSSVTAQGSFARLNQTYGDMTITWGQAETTTSGNKRLKKRRDCDPDDDWCDSMTIDFEVSPQIAANIVEKFMSYDEAKAQADDQDEHESPWENSYLLYSSNGKGAENGADSDGATKRSLSEFELRSQLEPRKIEKGFNLYCVDCGITGSFTIGGAFYYCIYSCPLDPGIKKAYAYLDGNLEAGIYLGLEAFAEYEKTWTKELVLINLLGWEIPDVASIGPYIELDLEAKFGVKAEGTLLIGGGASWPNFQATLDFVNPDQSGVTGFEPTLQKKFEAKAELSVEASIGLPLSLGIGVDIDDGRWKAHLALKNSPELKAEASISVSYTDNYKYSTVDGSTTADADNGWDLNDDCYGVNYKILFSESIDFEYELDPFVDATELNLFTWEYPFVEDCFGYKKPACEDDVRASPVIGSGVQCGQPLDSIDTGDTDYTIDDAKTVANRAFCAGMCLADEDCKGFSWAAADSVSSGDCQLYKLGVSDLSVFGSEGSTLAMFDKDCFQTKDCPYNATDPASPGDRKHKRMEGMYDARSGVYLRPLS